MNIAKLFEAERLGDTVVLNLRSGLHDFEFNESPAAASELLDISRDAATKNILVDCHEIDFLRSTALGFFVTLWKRVGEKDGRMVFCNLSANARQILRATKLDRIWTIRGSRDEALREIGD